MKVHVTGTEDLVPILPKMPFNARKNLCLVDCKLDFTVLDDKSVNPKYLISDFHSKSSPLTEILETLVLCPGPLRMHDNFFKFMTHCSFRNSLTHKLIIFCKSVTKWITK